LVGLGFADVRPANPAASIFKWAANVKALSLGRGLGEGGRQSIAAPQSLSWITGCGRPFSKGIAATYKKRPNGVYPDDMKRIGKLGMVILVVVVLLVVVLVFFHRRHAKQPTVSLIGVGLTIGNNGLEIQSVAPGTPAAKAGLHPGLVIQQIDGTDTADKPLVDCMNMTIGPIGSKLHLVVVDTATSETNVVEITREKFIVGAAP
jgi:PDZ domain